MPLDGFVVVQAALRQGHATVQELAVLPDASGFHCTLLKCMLPSLRLAAIVGAVGLTAQTIVGPTTALLLWCASDLWSILLVLLTNLSHVPHHIVFWFVTGLATS